jgi:hypothetical protein
VSPRFSLSHDDGVILPDVARGVGVEDVASDAPLPGEAA